METAKEPVRGADREGGQGQMAGGHVSHSFTSAFEGPGTASRTDRKRDRDRSAHKTHTWHVRLWDSDAGKGVEECWGQLHVKVSVFYGPFA